MTANGQALAVHDLRNYRVIRLENIARWRRQLERLVERQLLLERRNQILEVQFERERTLLNIAVHDLALANSAKDPAHFVRRWNSAHRQRDWGDE